MKNRTIIKHKEYL